MVLLTKAKIVKNNQRPVLIQGNHVCTPPLFLGNCICSKTSSPFILSNDALLYHNLLYLYYTSILSKQKSYDQIRLDIFHLRMNRDLNQVIPLRPLYVLANRDAFLQCCQKWADYLKECLEFWTSTESLKMIIL